MTTEAYLHRLGHDHEEPTVDYLFALHRAQVERVPYENLEIILGRPTTIASGESTGRIVAGRGGYCYHLNGAFGALLRELGFTVRTHVGGVHRLGAEPVGANGNHAVLTVEGLPTAECPDGIWFVDAGLGDAIHEPLPARTGEYRQGPFTYRLDPSAVAVPGWHFTHAPGGSFGGMDFDAAAVAGIERFAPDHAELSAPGSHFTKMVVCQRRDSLGAHILRDARLTRWDAAGKAHLDLRHAVEWRAVWADVFGIVLTPDEVDRLWPDAVKRTEIWLAEQATEAS
ncbi:arylamine N-acetyltransferase [Allocatelliglobosispora scoriae]|uniref:Arylamine N-acetyltransferase n=1 Tax=Allocatelliglobosispora scoriae TaxID=643052 RepID=A0A841BXC0_9ACTN|nr:arylamine N-acetyltransferase [Allocatelliglobosispora scoriae]MBB5872315.1 arylamine N-acetyltransferase [Allocatelliglobosispora scoriae]